MVTSDAAVPTRAGTTSTSAARGIAAAAFGNILEWYDWTIYASTAIFFAADFFPSRSATASLLSAFLVFALGFAVRPIGGWLIGSYCDRFGRRSGLALTIAMMGAGSLLIAVTPTYGVIGAAAPALLVLGRVIQGISYGGEVGSASAYIVEIAPNTRRGFFSSMFHFSVGIGLLTGSGLIALTTGLLDTTQMQLFGWRVPFIVGGLAALVGLWIRRHVNETDPFLKVSQRSRRPQRPLVAMLRTHPGAALKVCGLGLAGTLAFYLFVAYLPTYATREYGINTTTAFTINTAGLALYTLLQPLLGLASDRWGRKPLALTFSIGTAVLVVPLMMFLSRTVWHLILVQFVGLTLFALLAAVTPVMMAEQFPTQVRAVGIGVPYAVTVAIFGGTTPYLLTWLSSHGHATLFYWYIAAASILSTIAFLTMHDRHGVDLPD